MVDLSFELVAMVGEAGKEDVGSGKAVFGKRSRGSGELYIV
jgi:hypothetical protein